MIVRCMFIAVTLALVLGGHGFCQDEATRQVEIDRLIKQLGDETFKIRKDAKKALLGYGSQARRTLITQKDADDPEVRSAVNDLLEQLRSSIVPGAEQDVKELFIELEAGDKGSDVWKAIALKNPDHMGELLVEVSRNNAWKDALESGVFAFLANANPHKAADLVNTLNKTDRAEFIAILDKTNNALYEMKPKQMILLYCLKDYPRAVSRAYDVWEMNASTQAVDIAAMAIGRSGDPLKFWSIGGRKIYFENSLKKRCRLMSFYCGIAQRLGKTYLVKGFYSLGGVEGAEPDELKLLLRVLKESGDNELITRCLNGGRGASFKYETLMRFYKENDQTLSNEEWAELVSNVNDESELYDLFTVVSGYTIEHAQDLLIKITETSPKGSTYDMNAYRNLARYAEGTGRLVTASDYLREMVKINEQDGALGRLDKANLFHANELKTHAALESKAFTELMTAGLQLELDGKLDEAIALYKKAIEREPRQTCSYQQLLNIYRKRGDYQELNVLTEQMLKQQPLTTREKLEWSYRLSDVGHYDAAEKMLNEYGETKDAQLYIYYPAAILAERKGQLEQAETAYAELVKRTGVYGTVRRQMALVKMKLRKPAEAGELLLTHLLEQPFDRYARLLLYYSRAMTKQDDAASLKAYLQESNSRPDDWAHWLHIHALGEIDDAGLIKKAGELGPDVKHYGQVCEAYFYSGLEALLRGDTAVAESYFKKTVDMQITLFIEHNWAIYELKRLGKE